MFLPLGAEAGTIAASFLVPSDRVLRLWCWGVAVFFLFPLLLLIAAPHGYRCLISRCRACRFVAGRGLVPRGFARHGAGAAKPACFGPAGPDGREIALTFACQTLQRLGTWQRCWRMSKVLFARPSCTMARWARPTLTIDTVGQDMHELGRIVPNCALRRTALSRANVTTSG